MAKLEEIGRPTNACELHPALDDWMRGDCFGEIIKATRDFRGVVRYRVKLDKSGKIRKLTDANIFKFFDR